MNVCASCFSRHPSFLTAAPVRYLLAALLTCTLAAACADKNRPPPETARQRQERALRDPFAVGANEDIPDPAAGRDAHTFDRDGFKRDMDHFWNP